MQKLMAIAKDDKEEWVSITARSLGDFSAPLDLDAVMGSSSVVTSSSLLLPIHGLSY